MASQIVMDRTGDTRHVFNNQDRAEVAKAKQRFRELTGAGFTAAVRSHGGGNAVLSASGWRLTAVSEQILHAVSFCGLVLLLWALSLMVARSGPSPIAFRCETKTRALPC
jgi:hypothetical protein